MDMEKIRIAIEEVNRSAFCAAVDKLIAARHIYILGVRSSSFLAGYLHFYLHLTAGGHKSGLVIIRKDISGNPLLPFGKPGHIRDGFCLSPSAKV